ncbi:hypothetical protein R9N26_09630, partial [Escherichia coli]
MASFAYIDSEKWSKLNRLKTMIQRYFKEPLLQLTGELGRPAYTLAGFAPIFPDTCYHLTHHWPTAADIPV